MRDLPFILSTSLAVMTELASAQPAPPAPDPAGPIPAEPIPAESEAQVEPPPPAPAIDPRVLQLEADLQIELEHNRCELALDMLRRLHAIDPQYRVESVQLTDCVARVEAARIAKARPPEPVYETTVTSYRRQVIVADLVSFGLTFANGVGLIGYFFAAPVIHLANGNSPGALRSFGLRLIPIGVALGTGLGLSAGSDCQSNAEDGCFGAAMVGLAAGAVAMAVVIGIDWSQAKRSERRQVGVTWAPSVNITPETTGLGLVASW